MGIFGKPKPKPTPVPVAASTPAVTPDEPDDSNQTPAPPDSGIGPSPNFMQQQQQPQMNREQWRDAWMGAGQMSPDQADQWLSSHGAQQLGEKAGVWRTPSGDVLDLQIGRGGAKATGGKITPGWTQVGGAYGPDQNNGSIGPSNMSMNNNGMNNQSMMQQNNQPMNDNSANEKQFGSNYRNRMTRSSRGGISPSAQFGNNTNRLQNQGYSPS